MSIIRRKKTENYSVISNHCLQNKDLSWKAKGLFAYIMTLPDDWQLYRTELQDHSADGRESTKKAFDDLIDSGYIIATQTRDETGKLTGWEYDVFESPQTGFPIAGKPLSGKPISGKPQLLSTETPPSTERELNTNTPSAAASDKEGENKEPPPTPSSCKESQTRDFAEFWAAYPRKVGRAAALKAWLGIKHLPDLNTLIADVKARVERGGWTELNKQYIPHASTYLRGERWSDEIVAPRSKPVFNPSAGSSERSSLL